MINQIKRIVNDSKTKGGFMTCFPKNKRKIEKIVITIILLIIFSFIIINYNKNKVAPDDYLKNYYVENTITDTKSNNAVTAIYLNYRLFDSLFETLMLLVSVMAVIHFSKRRLHGKKI